MENVIINGIKILACEDQLRLLEIAEFYKALLMSKTGNQIIDSVNKVVLPILFKYISGYNHIITVTSIQELIDNFVDEAGITNWISARVVKRPEYKHTENIVNIKVYEFVYFKLWPIYLQNLKKSVENNESYFTFRFNIPKKVIEGFYENDSQSLSCFKKEVFEILNVNGFENCEGIDNDDKYTIEIK